MDARTLFGLADGVLRIDRARVKGRAAPVVARVAGRLPGAAIVADANLR